MHAEIFDEKTRDVFDKIKKSSFLKQFYLAGGTALALELGHRKSIDLDFFSKNPFDSNHLKKQISSLGEYRLENQDERTLDGILDGVKISFFHYEYEQLFPFIQFESIHLADERDISAMKLDAISSRGSRKDFVDLFFLLKSYSLPELILFFENKFNGLDYNKAHLIKSLNFFEDAEKDPMAVMLKDVSWDEVKRGIQVELGKMI